MKNRNLFTRKLEQLDTTLITLLQTVNRQAPVSEFKSNIDKAQNIVEDLKSMVERENMDPSEINKLK